MNQTKYVLLDLETTGLNPTNDRILEIGAIALTADLEEVARFECLVHFSDRLTVDEVVHNMHTKNGLWSECATAPFGEEAADVLLRDWLSQLGFEKKSVVLMGNSIHFDHSFLKARFPATAAMLHYRVMDIGGLRRWLTGFGIPLPEVPADMPHRSMPDCEIELRDARVMRRTVMTCMFEVPVYPSHGPITLPAFDANGAPL